MYPLHLFPSYVLLLEGSIDHENNLLIGTISFVILPYQAPPNVATGTAFAKSDLSPLLYGLQHCLSYDNLSSSHRSFLCLSHQFLNLVF